MHYFKLQKLKLIFFFLITWLLIFDYLEIVQIWRIYKDNVI